MSTTLAPKRGKDAAETTAPARGESAVVIRLRDMVMRGELAAGFHLQEIPLAERLGVSRTPIREALNILAKEGLLEPGPKRGFKVRTFSVDEIVQAYEVRACLEGMACRLLAERGIAPELEEELQRLLRVGDELLDRGMFTAAEHQPWFEMNNSIHSLLVEATANAMLAECVGQTLRVPLTSARHVHWYRFDQQNYERAKSAHRDHHKIIEAIAQRQAGRAEALMREHIHFSEALVREHFVNQRVGFDTVLLPLQTP